MPLSEFLRMARRKLECSQQKPAPTDSSARSENDLVELVWENGQIVMQGHSSRDTRSPSLNNIPSNTSRVHDARYGSFGGVESIMNEMAPVVPSGDMDLSQDDEIVPWLSYPMDDTLGQGCVSEILPEISGVTTNGMSSQNSFVSVDKRAKVSYSSKDHLFSSWMPQHRQTSDASGSGVKDITGNNSSNHLDAVFRNPVHSRDAVDGSACIMMERQNIPQPINDSKFVNFSNFSKPVTLVKNLLPNSDGIPKAVSPVVEKKNDVWEKGSAASCSNPVKSMHIEKFSSIPKGKDSHVSGMLPMVNSRETVAMKTQGPCPRERTKNLCQETSDHDDKALHPSDNDDSIKESPERERNSEPTVASSSIGSGNSSDRVSCEQTHHSKRKVRDIEESECRSDDLETESIDAKKPTHVRGSKRSRAAEVHNLSERRRRDRINEKMHALQELIPNCNKADKASMLDEAIEYIKNLQLQLQIMSMGSGLYMHSMMFPAGTHGMHPALVPHVQPMGVGFGMEMPDMNGGSSGCSIFPVPSLQLQHFPSPVSGLANFQRMPGPNIPVFWPPGQSLPSSSPRTTFVPLAPRPPLVTSSMGSSSLRNARTSGIPSTSEIMASKDPVTAAISQSMKTAKANSSVNSKSNTLQHRNEVRYQSTAVQQRIQKLADSASLPAATDNYKEPGCD